LLQRISPPLRAWVISVSGRKAVIPPISTDQNDLNLGEIAPAKGTSNEPKRGIKMISWVMVSTFMRN